MGSIIAENRKSLMLLSGRGYPALAEEIGAVLGIEPTPMDAYDFADGQIFVRYRESVRGSDAFVVQSMTRPINERVVESLLVVDGLTPGSAAARSRSSTRPVTRGSRTRWWRTGSSARSRGGSA